MELEIENKRLNDIRNLKDALMRTDYKVLKWVEGFISDEEYAPIRTERQLIREEIRRLENENAQN